jgi:UDP-2-acetamido-3-amino-2,3-dideoxy-glucuronate N-acetyltransferase
MAPTGSPLAISSTATIGEGVVLGAFVVIHDAVVIGDAAVVEDGAVLGKQPRLGPGSTADGHVGEPLVIEPGAQICANSVLFAGSHIGAGAVVGDQACVRERSVVGPGSVIGRGAMVEHDVVIGARVKLLDHAYLTAQSLVEDDVFVGPGTLTANDDSLGRHEPGIRLRGVVLRRACRIGAGALLLPGVEIGEEAVVAGGAVVRHDVPPRRIAMGVPARLVGEVEASELLENWR